MKVDKQTIKNAENFLCNTGRLPRLVGEDIELHHIGITTKQWKKYQQTGKLKVRQETAMRLKIIAIPGNSPHRQTLIKVIEARAGKKLL